MARSFRIFGKKRGHRRTGSKALGSAGEALFSALLLAMGAAFLVLLLVNLVIPEWRANQEFIETTATVLDKRNTSDIGAVGSDGAGAKFGAAYRPEVLIRYHVDGQPYENWTYAQSGVFASQHADRQSLDRIEIGREYLCWYDPLNPEHAVLVRGYSWWFWLFLPVPVGFMLIGGIGLVYALWQWGKSREHRAARGEPAGLDLFEEIDVASKSFPAVPHNADSTNSPGVHLKYRLPVHASQGWRLLAATAACLICNGIIAAFAVIAIRKHLRGEPDWWLDLFVLPFLLAGGALIYYLVRELLIATGVGPTLLEISAHPLWPGKTYEIHMTQTGHLSIKSFDVALECEEHAAYRQGTDTRIERAVVYRQKLFHHDDFEIVPAQPFQASCEFRVPESAMHSFKSDHNEVQWKLSVRGNAAGWPDFERSFPVVVNPPLCKSVEKSLSPPQESRALPV